MPGELPQAEKCAIEEDEEDDDEEVRMTPLYCTVRQAVVVTGETQCTSKIGYLQGTGKVGRKEGGGGGGGGGERGRKV